MTSQELRRKAAEAREDAANVVSLAEKENRELTEDEQGIVDAKLVEGESFEKRADQVERVFSHLQKSRQQGDTRTGEPIDNRGRTRDEQDHAYQGRIDGGESEADRRRSFSDWLTCIEDVSNRQTHRDRFEEAHDLLKNLYRSSFREWKNSRDPDIRRHNTEARNLTMSSGTAGGYLMPEDFYKRLMQVAAPQSLVRPRATVIPMAAETIKIPSLDQTTAQSAGNPPYFGGVVLTWSGESATITSTEPGFRQTTLTLNEVTGYTPVGRTLLQKSAISLEPLIYQLFGGAVAYAEDYAFLRGNGVGKPIGVLTAPCRIITAAGRGSATAISFANATNVWTRVLVESRGAGEWFVSQSSEAAVLQMTGSANGVFYPSGVYLGGADQQIANAGAAGVMLYMRPVRITPKLPAINTDGDFNFFDFSKYLIADGGPPEVASSDDYLFRTNERAFRIVHRVGGAPWLNNAITLEDGTTTVSPFVSLKIQ